MPAGRTEGQAVTPHDLRSVAQPLAECTLRTAIQAATLMQPHATRSQGRGAARDTGSLSAKPSCLYSASRRAFFRLRLRANACLTRSFWPGFK
jgi:hypothetical protein